MATTLDKLTSFRALVDDPLRQAEEFATTTDATTTVINLRTRPINEVTWVKVAGATIASNLYTVNAAAGTVTLVTAPAASVEVRVNYNWAIVTNAFLLEAYNAARRAAFPYLRQDIDTEVAADGVSVAVTGADRYDLSTLGAFQVYQVDIMSAATGGTVISTLLPHTWRMEDSDGTLVFLSGKPTTTTYYIRAHVYRPIPSVAIGATITTADAWDEVLTEYLKYRFFTFQMAQLSQAKRYATTILQNGIQGATFNSLAREALELFRDLCTRVGRPLPMYARPDHIATTANIGGGYRE